MGYPVYNIIIYNDDIIISVYSVKQVFIQSRQLLFKQSDFVKCFYNFFLHHK